VPGGVADHGRAPLIISGAAVDTQLGALEATLDEAEVKRAFATGAGEVVLAIDGSKLDSRGAAVSVAWDAIDLLVTDLDPYDERLVPYRPLVELR
jgi:DeoR/GlpR family transcriptional regulator of sugar metabolism